MAVEADRAHVERVRSFNRLVTQRVGALGDRYLGTGRPLGEARVLWEIGEEGCDVRVLRARLGLDSGYLSRVLRSLERAGLVEVGPSDHDRRVRTARPTGAGRAERRALDASSDELARSILEPLTPSQRERLVSALGEAERLLGAALVRFDELDPGHRDAQHCLRTYAAELDERVDGVSHTWPAIAATAGQLRRPRGLFVVARLRGEPVGCGGLKLPPGLPAEVKRMWVAREARGLGVGRRLLAELERRAAAEGCSAVRLETNGALAEAIALYRSSGYEEVEPFNDEPYAHHWFAKRLAAA
jgi:DNA-binding MarR family transcriptional regulator/GNAT superfamily N-acetyltransferase